MAKRKIAVAEARGRSLAEAWQCSAVDVPVCESFKAIMTPTVNPIGISGSPDQDPVFVQDLSYDTQRPWCRANWYYLRFAVARMTWRDLDPVTTDQQGAHDRPMGHGGGLWGAGQ